jgi:Rrf2 family transcriptional regulator, iron-sulfur cluster assembly transcription factor
MISKTTIHAIKAVAALADLDDGVYGGAADIAAKVGAPRNYLGKLLKTLAAAGLLESQKGKGGGFRLARIAEHLALIDIVEPIERVSRFSGCFLGRERCCDEAPCAVHSRWRDVRDAYFSFLSATTVADLKSQPESLRTLTH